MEVKVIYSVFLSRLINIVIVHPHCILRNYASPSHLVLCLKRGRGALHKLNILYFEFREFTAINVIFEYDAIY